MGTTNKKYNEKRHVRDVERKNVRSGNGSIINDKKEKSQGKQGRTAKTLKEYQTTSVQDVQLHTLEPGIQLDISVTDIVSQALNLLPPSLLVIHSSPQMAAGDNHIQERDIVTANEKNIQIHLVSLNEDFRGSNHYVVSQQRGNLIYIYMIR